LNKGNCPTKCETWDAKPASKNEFNFSEKAVLWIDSHDSFRLYQCDTCDTWYLWHWHEETDWEDGHDPVYHWFRSISDADVIAIKFFYQNAPKHDEFRNFLLATISGGSWAWLSW
jgi:hypothetical protein